MTKGEEKAEEILYGIGCMLLLGFLLLCFVYWQYAIPIGAGILCIIIVYKVKKSSKMKKNIDYEIWRKQMGISAIETKHIKTTPTTQKCPNCSIELIGDICELCGWTKMKPCIHQIEKVCLSYCNDNDKKICPRYAVTFIPKRKKKVKKEEDKSRSRRIPQQVKREVWRRDKGRCVDCGSRVNLEYDHIVPFSKGGSNTARNIELLCEKCNRSKSNKI